MDLTQSLDNLMSYIYKKVKIKLTEKTEMSHYKCGQKVGEYDQEIPQ